MLSLDDTLAWTALRHAYGAADDIPGLLRTLADDDASWSELYQAVLHQGTVYEAALACLPHVLSLALERPPAARMAYFDFLGQVAARMRRDTNDPFWKVSNETFGAADVHLDETLVAITEPRDALRLVAARAAFRGDQAPAELVIHIASGFSFEVECPSELCGVEVVIDFDETEGLAVVDELSTPTMACTEWEDAHLAHVHRELVRTGHLEAAAQFAACTGTVTCPKCNQPFSLPTAFINTLR